MSVQSDSATSPLAQTLSEYIAGAAGRPLPPAVVEKTRHHVLDTLAAIISGSRLKAGKLATGYVARFAGTPEATVIGTALMVPAEFAALANGMSGHADETDDSHLGGRFHPGCGIVPAALAVSELKDCGGVAFLRAVALGYDIGARLSMSLGYSAPNNRPGHSTHSLGTAFGAAAASAALLGFDAQRVRHVLSYAAQQASGVPYWHRDSEHVEKAFDFGGMGARNGVAGALMVAAGFTGVPDVLEGDNNALEAHSSQPRPGEMINGLGSRFFVTETAIKTFSVGYPVQSALDAFLVLRREHALTTGNVDRIIVTLPEDGAGIVDDRPMPDVNCQYLLAVALIDGGLSFDASHSYERMKDPEV